EMLRFKHIELISTRGRQVLMVMVLFGGEVRQRLITLPEPVSQEQLSATADRLTRILLIDLQTDEHFRGNLSNCIHVFMMRNAVRVSETRSCLISAGACCRPRCRYGCCRTRPRRRC
ncbi:MAG: hypothetical protein HGA47_13210, partial [Zoogloea sp.]|nr:hypothetical protein [Zoogloea sp.]